MKQEVVVNLFFIFSGLWLLNLFSSQEQLISNGSFNTGKYQEENSEFFIESYDACIVAEYKGGLYLPEWTQGLNFDICIKDIYSIKEGEGTALMKYFLEQYGHLTIVLEISPYGDDMDFNRLKNFYKRFGFKDKKVKGHKNIMIRRSS